MFEIENVIKAFGKDADDDIEVQMTLGQVRAIKRKFIVMRQTLRRIVSLDDKNVPKFAKQIAEDGLRLSH